MDAIRADWDDYRLNVIPLTAPEWQVIESRRAYYAGAGAVVRLLHDIDGTRHSPAVRRELDTLRQEVERFRAEVRANRA